MKLVPPASLLLSALFIAAGGVVAGSRVYAEAPAAMISSAVPQDAAQDNQTAADLTGSWQVSFTAPNGNQRQATLELKQDGNKLSGTFEGARGSVPVKGSVKGNDVSFDVKMPRRKIAFTGTVDGDKMSGTTEQGASWSATRE